MAYSRTGTLILRSGTYVEILKRIHVADRVRFGDSQDGERCPHALGISHGTESLDSLNLEMRIDYRLDTIN